GARALPPREEGIEDRQRLLLRRLSRAGEDLLCLAAQDRQDAVRRRARDRLGPVEIVLELGAGGLLAGAQLRAQQPLAPEEPPQARARGRVVADPLGDQV